MLKKALGLLLHDRKTLRGLLRLRLLDRGCRMFSNSGFYLQAKMDLDPKSWWHNLDFISAHGGRFIPGDATPREVLSLDSWDTVRRDMIILLLRELVARKIDGDMAELGVYRGLSARLIHHYLPERKLYLFDTFTGFDERDVKAELAATGRKTDRTAFSQTEVKKALAHIAPLNSNVEVFPGFFPESAPAFLARKKFAFVHLDADLHDPILAGLSFFYGKVVPGGFILVHDYNSWLGARKAVTEFFRDKPETPIPMPDKSGSALILKLAPAS
jgi:O-methyltransferase